MNCEKKPISIYQGFGTKWDNNDLLTVTFDSEIDIDGFGAEFIIGDIIKTYSNIENGFSINLTASESATLPLGAITGTLVIVDTENNKRPFSTELPFMVKDWADGDIKLDGFDISINAKVQENRLTINIQSANPEIAVEEMIKSYINEHNLSEEAHSYIQGLIDSERQERESADEVLQGNIEAEQERAETAEETIDGKIDSEIDRATAEENKKVDKVATTNRVYGTDGSGNQTTYPVDEFGKVDDVQVGGVSVVQNKIANLGTMASETESDYRKASNQDTIDNGIKNTIGSLSSLTTDAKNDIVSAINEIDSHADTNASDISDIKDLIPNDASSSNQLADKNFVNSSISTNTANFIGTFNSVAELEAYSGTLTNNDYAFVVGTDSAGNTVYDRYKYTDATTPASWVFEYELNNSSFTADQWAAINSLATSSKIAQITTNKNAIGTLSSLTTSAKTDLVSALNELNSNKQATLVSGTNIKTINNNSILGSGNLTLDGLPSQTSQSGKFLTTNGTTASWANIPTEIPSQTGQSGKFLTTNGTTASWGAITIPTVNNPTITITQGGVTKGSFTLNQSTGDTIALDAGGGGSYTAGTGIDITNDVISVINPVTVNTDYGSLKIASSNSLSNQHAQIMIGTSAKVSGEGSIAIGRYASASKGSLHIGNMRASGTKSISFFGVATGDYSIQLGGGTDGLASNQNANTFKVANANGNFEMMSADGTIPAGRLNIASSVDSSSTNSEMVGAKLFYDTCGDIETLINAL